MPRPKSLRSLTLNQTAAGVSNGPPSPTLSEATQASQMNFGVDGPEKIITRADLKYSLQSHENLITASAAYREALLHMSRATAAFADAMSDCASLKGTSYLSGSRLLAASGLHHLMGNHWHVLSDSIDKQFERPLRQHLDSHRKTVQDRSASYEKALREKSKIIKQTEMENMNMGRRKNRNLQTFREALAVLQRQVEDLDGLRVAHYQEILEHEEQVWDFVQGKVSLVVRSTLDVLDRFTSKASDPVIEPMLHSIPDPFDSYGPPKPEDQIFSILTPLAIFNSSSTPSPQTAVGEIDPSSSFSVSPSGLSWANEDNAYQAIDDNIQWAESRTPTASPPPTSAKSMSTVTETRERERAISFPGAASSKRSSYPPHSPPSKSPVRSPQHAKRAAESKLRKSLSAISEASTSTAQIQNFDPTWTSPVPPDYMGKEPPANVESDLHAREKSSDTIRGLVTSTISGSKAKATPPVVNGMTSFAEAPWGLDSAPTSPAFSREPEETSVGAEASEAG